MTINLQPFLYIAVLSVLSFSSCKKQEVDSEVESVIGISSGILTGNLSSAPNISKFTTWLSSFKVSSKQKSEKNLNFDEIALPEDGSGFKTPILSFTTKEINRLEKFLKLLEKDEKTEEDTELIKSYLMVETEEVVDILNVLLDKDFIPSEKSATGIEKINDFALFLKLADSDISLEFSKFILGELFKNDNLPDIVTQLNRESSASQPSEKMVYYEALVNVHMKTLGSSRNIEVMSEALSGLRALKSYLEGQSVSFGTQGYSFEGKEISGVPAAFIHFHQTFRKKTVDRGDISGAPNIPVMAGKVDNHSKLQGDEGTSGDVNIGGLNNSNNSNSFDFNNLVNSFYVNNRMSTQQVGRHNDQQIFEHSSYVAPINCKKQGLDSEGLVYCNLYGAYSNVPIVENSRTDSVDTYFQLTNEQCELPEYSYALVQHNHSPVQNQGREGACTAYGLIHALEATIQSVSPGTHISAQKLWNEYRRPYTNAAYNAAKSGFGGSGVLTAENGVKVRITGERRLRSVDDIKRAIACQGLGVKVASRVNNSWFQSSRGGDSVNCDTASGGAGHAYSFVGYDDTVSPPVFIIKNSWGSGWKSNGYATIKQSCWDSSTYRGGAQVMGYEIVGGQ